MPISKTQYGQFHLTTFLLALLCSHLVVPTSGSLAAYSETRSFRDALDGRSLEESISGPVDKDTSSYGDRAAQGPSSTHSAPGATMLTIPANGNMGSNNQVEQQQQTNLEEQQKSSPMNPPSSPVEPEIEREAGPVEGFQGADSPPLMEQRHDQRTPRAGRLIGNPASARQQQQQAELPEGGNYATKEASFGEEPAQRSSKTNGGLPSYGSRTNSNGPVQKPYEQPEDQQAQYPQQDQSEGQNGPANGNGEQELQQQPMSAQKGYGDNEQQMFARQRSNPSSMRLGRKPASNKPAAYMQAAKPNYSSEMSGQSQRQSAPPMMMLNANHPSGSGYQQQQQQTANLMGSAGLSSNGMRGMRRANQRKMEKMSPAMVNAILNKMLGKNQQQQQQYQSQLSEQAQGQGNYNRQMDQPSSGNNYGSNGAMGKPGKMAMLMMKSPMNAEALANMLMPQMPGSESMSPAKREEYKQMMVAAIMQQTAQPEQQAEQPYGMRPQAINQRYQSPGSAMMAPPAAVVMMIPSKQDYGQQQSAMEQQQQIMEDGPYSNRQAPKAGKSSVSMSMNGQRIMGGDYEQQQQQDQQYQKQPQREIQMQMPEDQLPQSMYSADGYAMNGLGGRGKNSPYGQQKGKRTRSQVNMNTAYSGPSSEQQQPEQQQQKEDSANGGYQSPLSQKSAGTRANGYKPQQEAEQQQQQQQPEQQREYPAGGSGTKSTGSSSNNGYEQQQEEQYGDAPMGQAEPFAFDYKVEDNYGNGHYRKEESDKDGVVRGSYGYKDVSGIYRHVEYVADENGFRAQIKSNEPGLSNEPATKGGSGPNANGSGYEQQQQQQQPPMVQMMTPAEGYGNQNPDQASQQAQQQVPIQQQHQQLDQTQQQHSGYQSQQPQQQQSDSGEK